VHRSSGKDIRTMGSGNIGATNVYRAAGKKAGIVVLILDAAKGFLAVWLAALITQNHPIAVPLAALAVLLGHSYPVFLHFKGGKAVACSIGAFLYLAPLALSVIVLVFIAVVALSRYVSLGSIVAAAAFPLLAWRLDHSPRPVLVVSVLAALLIVYRHKPNILRLVNGEESVFALRTGPEKRDSV
jgi:glycerol-3-phosphate acyltransferase PlsY